jgi:hypothetical protein
VAAVIVVAVLAVGWMVPRPRPRPSRHGALPLGGVPLVGPTGLRLLIADAPAPFVLEVDRGTIRPVTGLPTDGERGVSVLPVGNEVAPSRDGQGWWLLSGQERAAAPSVRSGSTADRGEPPGR